MGNFIQRINNSAVRDGTYLPTLDGWRAIAILLVIAAHGSDSIARFLQSIEGWQVDLSSTRHIGLFGVQIFFGLSGLLITSRLIADEKKHGRISLRSFYLRRAFRILPASLVFLATIGLLALSGVLPVSLGRWLSTFLFFANYSTAKGTWYLGHFWSLAVEEHFYFIWPVAFLALATLNRRIGATVAAALMLALWRALDFKFQITGSVPAVFWGRTDIQVDNIVWGVVIALLYGDTTWRTRLENFLRYPIVIPSLVILLIAFAIVPIYDWKIDFMLLTIKAIAIPMLILGTMINGNQILSYLLETPVFKLIGRLSYSIYLWQQLFLVWNTSTVGSMGILQSFPLNLIAALSCATLSMLFIEKPLISIGHKLASRLATLNKQTARTSPTAPESAT